MVNKDEYIVFHLLMFIIISVIVIVLVKANDSQMTLTEALVVAEPAGLVAAHVYCPAWVGAARLIFKQHVPLICVIA